MMPAADGVPVGSDTCTSTHLDVQPASSAVISVCKAHTPLHHSTLGLEVKNKRRQSSCVSNWSQDLRVPTCSTVISNQQVCAGVGFGVQTMFGL
jgi:hypothetical protein